MDEMNGEMRKKPVILLTGFGPFRNYTVNSSWEAVKLVNLANAHIVKHEITVAYDYVDEIIPKLWQEHKPTLVVHCGVSQLTNNLKLETQAFAVNYQNEDVNGCTPKLDQKSKNKKCECLTTEIDIEKVCEKVTQRCKRGEIKMNAEVSMNAGRYLCEYIYYASLNKDTRRTVFIHVPELSEHCSAADIAAALERTIEALLEEINASEKEKAKTARV